MIHRPCYLVIDPEHSGSISTRKLVLETAKLNVITAYSGEEAIAIMQKFPNVDGIVMDSRMPGSDCGELVRALKRDRGGLPVVVVGTGRAACDGADFTLESYNPKALLELLERLKPEATAEILRRDEELNRQEE